LNSNFPIFVEPSNIEEWLGKAAIPDEESLANQLAAPGYHISTGGKLVIESEAEMAKGGVANPDDADALAPACVSAGRD
jgi:hypothetical protein